MTESLLTKNLPAEIQAGRLRDETSGSDWNAPDKAIIASSGLEVASERDFFTRDTDTCSLRSHGLRPVFAFASRVCVEGNALKLVKKAHQSLR